MRRACRGVMERKGTIRGASTFFIFFIKWKTGATLLVSKLDRLSRDAHFITGLQKAGKKFVSADTPNADTFSNGFGDH